MLTGGQRMENLTNTQLPEAASAEAALVSRADTAVRGRRLSQHLAACAGVSASPCFSCHLTGCDVFLLCSLMSCLGMLGLSSCQRAWSLPTAGVRASGCSTDPCPRAAAGVASDSSRVRGELELEPCVNFLITYLGDLPALSSPLLASPTKHSRVRLQK